MSHTDTGCLMMLLMGIILCIVIPLVFWGTIWVAVLKYLNS